MPWRWILAVGVAIGTVKFALLFVGMDVGMPAGLSSLVLQVAGVLHARLRRGPARRAGRARRRRPGCCWRRRASCSWPSGLDGLATPTGFALVVAAAAAWGIGNVAIKRAAPDDALRFMTWICVVPPLPMLALSLAFEGPAEIGDALAGVDLGGIAAVAYIAFAATTVGWGLWAFLLRTYSAGTVAPFSLLVPVFGLGFAALLLDEPLTARTVIAAALVVSGVMLTQRAPRISPQIAATSAPSPCAAARARARFAADAEVETQRARPSR